MITGKVVIGDHLFRELVADQCLARQAMIAARRAAVHEVGMPEQDVALLGEEDLPFQPRAAAGVLDHRLNSARTMYDLPCTETRLAAKRSALPDRCATAGAVPCIGKTRIAIRLCALS